MAKDAWAGERKPCFTALFIIDCNPLYTLDGGGGKLSFIYLGLWIIISIDFLVFIVKWLAAAQSAMDLSSMSMVCDSDAGIMRYVSSADLNNILRMKMVLRSDALTT